MASDAVPMELYLRRLTVDEALYRLEQYMDDAFMSGHPLVRLVHGKGTGAVRSAVWDLLAGHPLVKSYRLGTPGEGDAGVTLVELHQREPGAGERGVADKHVPQQLCVDQRHIRSWGRPRLRRRGGAE